MAWRDNSLVIIFFFRRVRSMHLSRLKHDCGISTFLFAAIAGLSWIQNITYRSVKKNRLLRKLKNYTSTRVTKQRKTNTKSAVDVETDHSMQTTVVYVVLFADITTRGSGLIYYERTHDRWPRNPLKPWAFLSGTEYHRAAFVRGAHDKQSAFFVRFRFCTFVSSRRRVKRSDPGRRKWREAAMTFFVFFFFFL